MLKPRFSTLSLTIGLVVAALAAPSALAAPLGYTGTLTLEIVPAGIPLPGVVATATGTAEVAPDHSITLNFGDFSIQTTVTVPSPDLINAVIIAGGFNATPPPNPTGAVPTPTGTAFNGTGNFTPSGGPSGGFGGKMPLVGYAFAQAFSLVNVPVPLTVVGSGGFVMGGLQGLAVSVTGFPWTTGAVTLPASVTSSATTMRTGFDTRTSMGVGMIQLVTPIRIKTNVIAFIPAFGTLKLTFVPEPGVWTMLIPALLVVAAGARRRRRSH